MTKPETIRKREQRAKADEDLLYFFGWVPQKAFEFFEDDGALTGPDAGAKERGRLVSLVFLAEIERQKRERKLLSPWDTISLTALLAPKEIGGR